MSLLRFLGSNPGRWTRASIGAVLIIVGLLLGGWWALLAVLGTVFFAAGSVDFCLLAPLAGRPVRGTPFRKSFAS